MAHVPRVLEARCEWTAADVADEASWTERLDQEECAELDAALRHALAHSDDVLAIGREHFPLPHLGPRLREIQRELIDGRGFVRLRGIDRDRYSQAEMEMLYWGIGMHLGSPWPQNKHGHVLGDVTDQGKRGDDPTSRGNEIGGSALPFHCDGSDLVGLMCLRNGREGGLSAVANAVLIHNTLVRESPELAAELYLPQPFDFRGEQPPGKPGWYALPIFTEWNGRLFVRCIRPYILASQRHEDAPRLTPRALEALDRVEALANDPDHHVKMALEPGDMQFINNYHVLHGRTAYTDDRAEGRVRHLKRLWLETDVLAERPPYFANHVGSHWNDRRSASRIEAL
ncbi:MAG: taurine catabolism dioxygenase TauD [Gammaproteobacteria bacterium]|nr:MAG: taurine catabolism dioxygenase TauD [Gammaproteobacteria bacterium]